MFTWNIFLFLSVLAQTKLLFISLTIKSATLIKKCQRKFQKTKTRFRLNVIILLCCWNAEGRREKRQKFKRQKMSSRMENYLLRAHNNWWIIGLKNSKSRFRSVISAASDIDTNQKTFFVHGKKTETITLWHSLIPGRHAYQDVSNWRGLEPRLRCSHNFLSDQNAVISSGWWPSLVLLMFWTDFLSFGEMFDLVYFNYCPSFLFFPISLERCKTKENIDTSWLSIRWLPHGGMT